MPFTEVNEFILPRVALRQIQSYAAAGYPEEQCGLLEGSAGRVTDVHMTANTWSDREQRVRRFLLNPLEQLRIERSLDGTGSAIIGSFHSHPDHPAEPSAFDAEAAWPGYWYLIVPVKAGVAGEPRAWRIDPATGAFVEQTIAVDPE